MTRLSGRQQLMSHTHTHIFFFDRNVRRRRSSLSDYRRGMPRARGAHPPCRARRDDRQNEPRGRTGGRVAPMLHRGHPPSSSHRRHRVWGTVPPNSRRRRHHGAAARPSEPSSGPPGPRSTEPYSTPTHPTRVGRVGGPWSTRAPEYGSHVAPPLVPGAAPARSVGD